MHCNGRPRIGLKRKHHEDNCHLDGRYWKLEPKQNVQEERCLRGDKKVGLGEPQVQFETDPATLARRQKQIDYGKNTEGYVNYVGQVPKDQRATCHPQTPDKNKKVSRRAWDGEVRMWRLLLHAYDPPNELNTSSRPIRSLKPDIPTDPNQH